LDDDIFALNKNIVLIHNLQRFINIDGQEINDRNTKVLENVQPNKETIISKDNIFYLWKKYNFITHNFSSMSIRKYILDKYINYINDVNDTPDTSLFLLSLMEGYVLHIPVKLTYYRISYGYNLHILINYDDFLKQKNKSVCRYNKYIDDFRKLYSFLNCNECKKVVESLLTYYEVYLFLLNDYFNCIYKADTLPRGKLFLKLIRSFTKSELSLSSMIKFSGAITASLFYKRIIYEAMMKKNTIA
jgi:hypothetical protein